MWLEGWSSRIAYSSCPPTASRDPSLASVDNTPPATPTTTATDAVAPKPIYVSCRSETHVSEACRAGDDKEIDRQRRGQDVGGMPPLFSVLPRVPAAGHVGVRRPVVRGSGSLANDSDNGRTGDTSVRRGRRLPRCTAFRTSFGLATAHSSVARGTGDPRRQYPRQRKPSYQTSPKQQHNGQRLSPRSSTPVLPFCHPCEHRSTPIARP